VLKLVHTADWHLGRRFPSFPEEAQKKLSRARMEVVDRILDVARRQRADAVVCAGDVFDEPAPSQDFWEGLVTVFRGRGDDHPPVFLLPGNHDPLTPESVWAPGHPFRRGLPRWVQVVDSDGFEYALSPEAVLYARPCRFKAGDSDPAMALPAREPGGPPAADRLRPWLDVRHRGSSDELSHPSRRRRSARPQLPRHRRHPFLPRRHREPAGADGVPGRARADQLRRGRSRQGRGGSAVPGRRTAACQH